MLAGIQENEKLRRLTSKEELNISDTRRKVTDCLHNLIFSMTLREFLHWIVRKNKFVLFLCSKFRGEMTKSTLDFVLCGYIFFFHT